MPNFCQDKLRFELGEFVTLSLRNGNLVRGTVIGTFQNKVQLGGGNLVILNSAGRAVTPLPPPNGTAFIEVLCDDIIAASGGEQKNLSEMPKN
ncbi:hypothetical protein [Desulfolucanica intricata]|uniref:hypothetical protein n=1 Tax=Desulfolucanica intricata TaxID=1285191 RepID=UPI000831E69A|nr:hypothetical protein [Desulfolucanica intricata]